ncbi:hypothetical protein H4R34_004805, partial [Dimargaris verticillata]
DWLLMALGTFGAIASGVALPLMVIVLANIMIKFVMYQFKYDDDPAKAAEDLNDGVNTMMVHCGILAVCTFVAGCAQTYGWSMAAERQTRRMRERYYEAILRQEIAWFDTVATGDLTTRISGDINVIQDGMSSKLANLIKSISVFVTAFVVAFIKGWELGLVVVAAFPVILGAGIAGSMAMAAKSKGGLSSYAAAGAIAEEVIAGIRTVVAFGGQEREIQRYGKEVGTALRVGIRRSYLGGLGSGSVMCATFLTFAMGFWYGIKLVADRELDAADMMTIFFSLVTAAIIFGRSATNFFAIGAAQGAASKVFALIARHSHVDPLAETGQKLDYAQGRIEFRNVHFHYPTRPDVPILRGVSLSVEPGETVALVGASGSGKSTIVSLLERFYDPSHGQVLLDGVDIRDINVQSLRQHIGIVSQEPVLFGESIKQNVKWGASGNVGRKDVTDAMVEQACRDANAYDFIQKLHGKFDALVGEKGALLSGGQKQRIAIARAIIKDPRILLLDEATSALDTQSERLVQDALDQASKHRTTIVIAHRLSTIRDADKIVVMNRGEIVEVGTHNSLLAQKGMYAQLVSAQELKQREVGLAAGANFSMLGTLEDGTVSDITTVLNGTGSGSSATNWLASHQAMASDPGPTSVRALGDGLTRVHSSQRRLSKRHSQRSDSLGIFYELTDQGQSAVQEEQGNFAKASLPLKRLLRLCKPELKFIIPGFVFAFLDALIMPAFAAVFVLTIMVFQNFDDPGKMRSDANFYCLLYVNFGVLSWIFVFARTSLFDISGEHLTHRMRMLSFRSIVYQDAAFFDDRANGTGVLCTKLSTESERVKPLAGQIIAAAFQSIVLLALGLAMAFYAAWQLTLVVLAVMPLIIASEVINAQSMAGFEHKIRKAYNQASQTASESVACIQTVAALGREKMFIDMFQASNEAPHQLARRGSVINALATGFAQSQLYIAMIICFYYGSRLLIWQTHKFDRIFIVVFALLFVALGVSQTLEQVGDVTKAKIAAISLFRIVDRQPSIDLAHSTGHHASAVQGQVDAHQVSFSYPTRPDIPILHQVSVTAKPGQAVALVGHSGSGKSTLMALAQRLYDVASGSVSVDETDVRQWELPNLRSHMAIVGQEPVLFGMSIRDNIAYGKPDATMDEIEAAARSANIHDFIAALPEGYDTSVGERGGQLSGGQKQRIAIARALIRNPRLLLLDEATSALDSQSETLVQQTLDEAAKGRTTLTIAHRLSTIQNADLIIVFENGRVVESGTHFDLVDRRGLYYTLVQEQSLEVTV